MFLLKIFYFLKGYVIIEITGGDFARFINICTARGIRLWSISPTRASLWECDFAKIRPVARKAGVKIKIVRKCSLKRRISKNNGWFTLLCAAVFAMFFVISAQYVWSIEIDGCESEAAENVLLAAEEFGLRVGVRKSTLPDGNTMRDAIIYNVDGINWAWVYFEGTKVRIEASADIPKPQIEDNSTPCNITASRDGIITRISEKGGRSILSAGVAVDAGEIVISGAMPGGERTAPYQTAAEGEVYAKTLHTASCEWPLTKVYTRDTGNELTRYAVRLFELEIPLWSARKLDFEEYRSEIHTPPAGICRYRYIETETVSEPMPEDTAVYEAKEALYEKIAAELAPGSVRIDERLESRRVSENKIKVTLTMSFIENIGVKTPIEAWQMEELANDKTD